MDKADYEATILEHINIDYDPHLAVHNAAESARNAVVQLQLLTDDLDYAVKNGPVFSEDQQKQLKFAQKAFPDCIAALGFITKLLENIDDQ